MRQDLPLVLHLACEEGLRSIGREQASSNIEAMFWTDRAELYQGLVRHMEESGSDLPDADGEVCGV